MLRRASPLAALALVAAACGPSSIPVADAGGPDASTHEAGGDDAGDAAAVIDGGADAPARDTGPDAGALDSGLTIACDASTPCPTGVCEDGFCTVMAETPMPYDFGRCEMWTADPPPNVDRFVVALGMLWGAGDGGEDATYVVRRDDGNWVLSFDPRLGGGLMDIQGSDDVIALRVRARGGVGSSILRRDADAWVDVTDGLPLSGTQGRLAVSGSTLYVIDDAGVVHEHDGIGWTALPSPPTPAHAGSPIATTDAALYIGTPAGSLLRWNGTSWQTFPLPSVLPMPPPITSLLVGDEASVFANGTYRFDGSALINVPGGRATSAARGHVIGRNGTATVEWTGAAWTTLVPTTLLSPAWAGALVITALPDGYLLRNPVHVWVHGSTGDLELWRNGPTRVAPGSIPTDVWAAGVTGLLHLSGSSWSTAAGTEMLSPPSDGMGTFRAPDGTVFVSSQISEYGNEVSDYRGGVLTSLLTFRGDGTDGTNSIRGIVGARSGDNVVVWRRTGLTTWNGATWGGPGQGLSESFGFAIAGASSAVSRNASHALIVFDGSVWSFTARIDPPLYTGPATLMGDPVLPLAAITDAADELGTGIHVFTGTTWTTSVLPSGLAVEYVIGPDLDHLVARGGQGSDEGFGWLDASGNWRFSSTIAGIAPVATDGMTEVWADVRLSSDGPPFHDGWGVSRCIIER